MKKRGLSGLTKKRYDAAADDVTKLTQHMGESQSEPEYAFRSVPTNAITKLENPRDIPISLDEMRSFSAPALDIDMEEELPEALDKAIEELSTAQRSPGERSTLKDFLIEIHSLAASIKSKGQAQPVVLNEPIEGTGNYTLIAGERRVLASIYADANSTVQAKVYAGEISEEKINEIKDAENYKISLTYSESIKSKYLLYMSLPEDKKSLPQSKLTTVLDYKSKSQVNVITSLAKHRAGGEIIEKAIKENWARAELLAAIRADTPPTPPVKINKPAKAVPALKINKGKHESVHKLLGILQGSSAEFEGVLDGVAKDNPKAVQEALKKALMIIERL